MTYCVQSRKKIMQMLVDEPVKQSIEYLPGTSKEEKLKSSDTTSAIASGSDTPAMNSSLFRTAESTFVVSLLFSYSFFPFSSDTIETPFIM